SDPRVTSPVPTTSGPRIPLTQRRPAAHPRPSAPWLARELRCSRPTTSHRRETMQAATLLDPLHQFEVNDEHDVIGPPLVREQLEDLPGQPRGGGCGDPERALMRAMLLDAVLCLIGQSAPAVDRPRLAAEARAWIVSRSREWIYAFERVCEALHFDADYLRRRLLQLA